MGKKQEKEQEKEQEDTLVINYIFSILIFNLYYQNK